MLKCICATSIILISGLVTADKLQPRPELRFKEIAPEWADPAAVARNERAIDAEWQAYKLFHAKMEATIAALARNEICLCQAIEAINDSSIVTFPTYLRRLKYQAGNDDKDKIGSAIVLHFNALVEYEPGLASIAQRVEREFQSESFQKWCSQPWESAAACPHASAGAGHPSN